MTQSEVHTLVCAPDVAEVVRSAAKQLGKKLKVYEDPLMEAGKILILHKAPELPKPKSGWTVYTDPEMDEETEAAVQTMKGKSVLDTGYVNAPYIPLSVTPGEPPKKSPLQELAEEIFKEEIEAGTIKPIWLDQPPSFDPEQFTMRAGIKKRFMTKLVDPKFYGTVDITNL